MDFEEQEEEKEKKSKRKKVNFQMDGQTDAEEIKEILGAVSTEVPDLIRNVFSAIFDPSIAENYGKGIGALYRQLKEEGIPDEMIDTIVMNFSDTFNIVGNAMKNIDIDKKRKDEDD